MMLSFELSMPTVTSWDGKWSGENRSYAIVKRVRRNEAAVQAATRLVDEGYFTYRFSDGWVAAVIVKQVDHADARRLRNNTLGFCGYDWMVDDLLKLGRIRTVEEKVKN